MNIEFLSRGELSTFLRTAGYSGGLISKLTNLVNSQLCNNLPNIIEGMSVSVDVSTNDHDSGNRLFGVVNEVMEDVYDKSGYTLLVYETEPNFDVDKTKVSQEEHDKTFEQWWMCAEGKDKHGYLMDKESAKTGYDIAIAINNI